MKVKLGIADLATVGLRDWDLRPTSSHLTGTASFNSATAPPRAIEGNSQLVDVVVVEPLRFRQFLDLGNCGLNIGP